MTKITLPNGITIESFNGDEISEETGYAKALNKTKMALHKANKHYRQADFDISDKLIESFKKRDRNLDKKVGQLMKKGKKVTADMIERRYPTLL